MMRLTAASLPFLALRLTNCKLASNMVTMLALDANQHPVHWYARPEQSPEWCDCQTEPHSIGCKLTVARMD